jgi:hypothetical protein
MRTDDFRFARHAPSCHNTCQTSLTLRVQTFFCCQRAQVKHSLFAPSFDSRCDTRFTPLDRHK